MKPSFSQLLQGTALAATLVSGQSSSSSTPILTLTVQPVTTTTAATTVGPILISTSSNPAQWNGIVTVTSYRTVTDFCGCGIPGISTVGPILISTTTSASGQVNPTLISTSTSTSLFTSSSFTSSGSTIILPPETVTTSLTTTTTSGGAIVSPTLISDTTTSSSTSTSTSTTSMTSLTTTTTTASTTTTTATTTTTTAAAVVTDQAYINTILRHHNVHRTNHTVPDLVWSPSLAATAQKIAASCNYGHDTSVDGGGYGQNIGAGYPSTQMGAFVTEGLYNPEVNSYTYYGGEPDTSTVGQWGHMSQIVWKSTTSVGCYTQDCSATGLQNAPGIPPFFTVCNYSPAGNVVGAFGANVLRPVGNPTVFASYNCPTTANCV